MLPSKMSSTTWWGPRELYELDTEADAQAGWEGVCLLGMDGLRSSQNGWEFLWIFGIFWLSRIFF